MSTTPTPTPNPVLVGITQQVATYANLVDPTIKAIETQLSGIPGATKLQVATTIISNIAHAGETNANPNVALISALVDIGVSIANEIGEFVHATKAATAPVAPVVTPVVATVAASPR